MSLRLHFDGTRREKDRQNMKNWMAIIGNLQRVTLQFLDAMQNRAKKVSINSKSRRNLGALHDTQNKGKVPLVLAFVL